MSWLLFQRTGQRPLPDCVKVKLIRLKISIVNKPTKCPGCCYKGQVSAHCLVVSSQTDSIHDIRREVTLCHGKTDPVNNVRHKIAYKSVLAAFCYKGQVSTHCLVVSRSN